MSSKYSGGHTCKVQGQWEKIFHNENCQHVHQPYSYKDTASCLRMCSILQFPSEQSWPTKVVGLPVCKCRAQGKVRVRFGI